MSATRRANTNARNRGWVRPERYYRRRPKGNRDAAIDLSAYTRIATDHGLAPRFGHAAFEGSRSAVDTAVAAYRAAGYAISQSDADRGALSVVTSPDQQVTITLTVRTEPTP